MNFTNNKFQVHKYRNGHQLVQSNIELDSKDQDTVDRLSDISGQIRPNEAFEPYFTCYPVPSSKYFVIARTWQDLDAPRAGCVVTISLIIPQLEWVTSTNVEKYYKSLINIRVLQAIEIKKETGEINLQQIRDFSPLNELVESVFLENREPILIYDCNENDRLCIIIRLYNVFWPKIRADFSVCTLALSPRSLNGKSFDLSFTVSDLRSRFAEWNGRRIDANKNNTARHRWTNEMVNSIFVSKSAYLINAQTNNFLKIIGFDNESDLRLGLLWNELIQKVRLHQSPFAILGLLDIINSQTKFSLELYEYIKPDVSLFIANVPAILENSEAWKFYLALLLKHQKKLMDREMLSSVRNACVVLAFSNPNESITFLNNINIEINIPAVLFVSIGDGLASHGENLSVESVNNVDGLKFLKLVAKSKKLTEQMMTVSKVNLFAEQMSIFNYIDDKKLQNNIVANLQPFLLQEYHFVLLNSILNYADSQIFETIVTCVSINTQWKYSKFNNLVVDIALKLKKEDFIVDLLAKDIYNNKADEILLDLLNKNNSLLESFLRPNFLSKAKVIYVIVNLLKNKFFPKKQIFDYILRNDSLIMEIMSNSDIGEELLFELVINSTQSYNLKMKVISTLSKDCINSSNNLIRDFISDFLRSNFSNIGDESIIIFFSKLHHDLVDLTVFHFFKNRNLYTVDKLYKIMNVFLNSGPLFIKALSRDIDETSVAMFNLKSSLSKNISEEWIKLFKLSNSNLKKTKAAKIMLQFSFNYCKFDATNMLVCSFTVVYLNLVKERENNNIFIFSYLFETDKPKFLRHDLVVKYMKSNWSSLGLLKVAIAAKIAPQILSKVYDSNGGRKYLKKMFTEIVLDKSDHSQEMKILQIFFKHKGIKY